MLRAHFRLTDYCNMSLTCSFGRWTRTSRVAVVRSASVSFTAESSSLYLLQQSARYRVIPSH